MKPSETIVRASQSREHLWEALDSLCHDWETAMLVSKINIYYLTGTQQSGVLVLRRGKDQVFYVRRSYHRAMHESSFENIVKINSFKDTAAYRDW